MKDIVLVLMDGTRFKIDYKSFDHFNRACKEADKDLFIRVATYKRDAAGLKYDFTFRMISKYAMKELTVDD